MAYAIVTTCFVRVEYFNSSFYFMFRALYLREKFISQHLNTDLTLSGAFLIPYLIMLFVEGMPILYLEFAFGQKMQKGTVIAWNEVNPLLGGIGIASAVTSFNVAIYYNAIIMWCFFYLFHSFQSPLPWATCPMEFSELENKTIQNEECYKSGPTSYFWYRQALDVSPNMETPDGIKWKMLLCLIFAWLIVYACIWKGIKSSGKVSQM